MGLHIKSTMGEFRPAKKKGIMKSLHFRPIDAGRAATAVRTVSFVMAIGLVPLTIHADPGTDNRAPDVPASLQVPEGNKVSFHAYAVGVQIYGSTPSTTSATGFAWTFQAPEAVLFDSDGNVVGMHY